MAINFKPIFIIVHQSVICILLYLFMMDDKTDERNKVISFHIIILCVRYILATLLAGIISAKKWLDLFYIIWLMLTIWTFGFYVTENELGANIISMACFPFAINWVYNVEK